MVLNQFFLLHLPFDLLRGLLPSRPAATALPQRLPVHLRPRVHGLPIRRYAHLFMCVAFVSHTRARAGDGLPAVRELHREPQLTRRAFA